MYETIGGYLKEDQEKSHFGGSSYHLATFMTPKKKVYSRRLEDLEQCGSFLVVVEGAFVKITSPLKKVFGGPNCLPPKKGHQWYEADSASKKARSIVTLA